MPIFHIFAAPVMSAHPYLDPGSGSLLVQLLLAAGLGAGFLVKVFWKKITGIFKKGNPEADETSQIETDGEDEE